MRMASAFLPNVTREERVAKVKAFATAGFPFDDECMGNSQDELAVPTSRSHNLRRRSNGCMELRDVGVGRALPGVPQGECGARGRHAVPLHLAQLDHAVAVGGPCICPPFWCQLASVAGICFVEVRRSSPLGMENPRIYKTGPRYTGFPVATFCSL